MVSASVGTGGQFASVEGGSAGTDLIGQGDRLTLALPYHVLSSIASHRPTVRLSEFGELLAGHGISDRTGREKWGRCERVTHRSGRSLPYALPLPDW